MRSEVAKAARHGKQGSKSEVTVRYSNKMIGSTSQCDGDRFQGTGTSSSKPSATIRLAMLKVDGMLTSLSA